MKAMLGFGCAFVGLAAVAMTDAEFNAAYQAIRNDRRNQPRYCQYQHARILSDLESLGRTNELTQAQRQMLAAKVAEHANAREELRPTFDAAMAEIRSVTNLPRRVSLLNGLFDAFLHTYSFSRPRGLPEAERILAETIAANDARRVMQMRQKFVEVGLAVWHDRAKAAFDREYAALRAYTPPADQNPARQVPYLRQRSASMGALLAALVTVDPKGAEELFVRDEAMLEVAARNAYRLAVADYAIKMKDRPLFDRILKGVLDEPIAVRIAGLYRPMLTRLQRFDPETAAKIVDADLAAASLLPGERMFFLSVRQGFDDPPIFDYGFNRPGRYGRWRAALLERKAISEANPTNRTCAFFANAGAIAYETERMIWYDDLATAKPIVEQALVRWPDDRKLREQEARIRAMEGDSEGAIKSFLRTLEIKGTKPDDTNRTLRVIAFLKGEGLSGFDRVNAPLALTEAARLKALRETSRCLFNCRRYEDCRAIFAEIIGNMYRPDPRKMVAVRHVAYAPQTAGAFVLSPYYADWRNYETRFSPYGDCYGENAAADEKWHLKGARIPVCDPAWKTGVQVLCDDEGVHVYVRGDDPQVGEVKDGVRDAGGLEMFFAPGDLEVPYHSIFFDRLPGTDDPHAADWCSPGRHYRRNADAYTKDAVLTPEGVVAHVSLPWMSFYDNLPEDGKCWNLGVIRSCKAGMQTSGGVVHELSRGLQLKFELTASERLALRRRVAIKAFNRYRKLREGSGEFIQRWNDPLLGDPEFYAAEVAPLLERLDKAGMELMTPCPDSDIPRFFTQFVPLWAEIGYEIAERRTRYLNERLFRD